MVEYPLYLIIYWVDRQSISYRYLCLDKLNYDYFDYMRCFMNGKDKNHSFSIIIILISIIISFYYFGLSASFLISALFIIFVATKVLQHLEDRNLLSCIGIIGPFIMDLSKKNFLYTLQYNSLISTNNNSINNFDNY